MQWLKVGPDVSCVMSVLSSVLAQCIVFGRPFVKRFALCYRPMSVCRVCDVGVLWPNAWTDQDETWHAGIGLGPGHSVRWGPSSPKRAQPQIFSAHICCGQMAAWINMPLGMEVGLGLGEFLLDYRLKK